MKLDKHNYRGKSNLKRFGDRAFGAYSPHLRNELPDNIKAADTR